MLSNLSLTIQEPILSVLWLMLAAIVVCLSSLACCIDIRCRIVPNWLVFLLAGLGVLIAIFDTFGVGFPSKDITLFERFLGALLVFVPLTLLAYGTRSIGFGDVKLAAVLGFILGLKGALIAMCATAIVGAVLAVVYMLVTRFINRSIAYAPAICIGFLIAANMIA